MKKSLLWTAAAIVVATAGLGSTAYAHGGNVPEHGGVIQLVADTSVELVTRPTGVEVWIEEEGEEIPSAAMTGALVVVQGGATQDVALQPGPGNMWEARGLTLAPGAKVTVLMADKNSHAKTTASFTIK
jgi:hypothetical protein